MFGDRNTVQLIFVPSNDAIFPSTGVTPDQCLVQAVSRSAAALQQIMPLDFSYRSMLFS
jgi:hypothetical protein